MIDNQQIRNYTWGEIQIESCKKMFLNNGPIKIDELPSMKLDNKYKWYLNAMPHACNEAIYEIIKRGKKHLKQFNFSIPKRNGLSLSIREPFEVIETMAYDVENGKSYYFEVNNEATINIIVGDTTTIIENEPNSNNEYKVYKGFINNPNNEVVTIEFVAGKPYQVRNLGIYTYDYNYENDDTKIEYIPANTRYTVIDLQEKLNDFYKINKFYYQHDNEYQEMINNTDYQMINSHKIVIDSEREGNYIIEYINYPVKIDDTTPAETVIELEPEMCALIPLYIASQLYKDDDISLATQYRNEFEASVDNTFREKEDLQFVSITGWL